MQHLSVGCDRYLVNEFETTLYGSEQSILDYSQTKKVKFMNVGWLAGRFQIVPHQKNQVFAKIIKAKNRVFQ